MEDKKRDGFCIVFFSVSIVEHTGFIRGPRPRLRSDSRKGRGGEDMRERKNKRREKRKKRGREKRYKFVTGKVWVKFLCADWNKRKEWRFGGGLDLHGWGRCFQFNRWRGNNN